MRRHERESGHQPVEQSATAATGAKRRRSVGVRKWSVGASIVALVLAGGGVAYASSGSTAPSSEVIHGCYSGGNGMLRVVQTATSCHHNETAISWNQVGQEGPAGPAGTNGRTVLNGTTTPPPSAGEVGDFWLDTMTHVLYGPKTSGGWLSSGTSLVGPQGPQGTQGIQGIQGIQGATGSTGPQGPKGTTGQAGPEGKQGTSGQAGPEGPKGTTGPQGPAGPAGPTGSTGPQGPAGSSGVLASSGSSYTGTYTLHGTTSYEDVRSTTLTLSTAGTVIAFGSVSPRLGGSNNYDTQSCKIGLFGPANATGVHEATQLSTNAQVHEADISPNLYVPTVPSGTYSVQLLCANSGTDTIDMDNPSIVAFATS